MKSGNVRTTLRRVLASAAGLALAASLAACGSGADDSALNQDGMHAATVRAPSVAAPQVLTDTDNAEFTFTKSLDTPLTLVFFGYTSCPDICSMVMGTIASAFKKLPEDARSQVRVVFVSTDPARDTGKVLRDYLDRFNPDFQGVRTENMKSVIELGTAYGTAIEQGEKLPSGGYDVAHNDYVLGLDGTGQWIWTWNRDVRQGDLVADIEKILAERGEKAETK